MSEDNTPHASAHGRRGLSLAGASIFHPAGSIKPMEPWRRIRLMDGDQTNKYGSAARRDGHISLIHLQYRRLEMLSLPRAVEVCKNRPFQRWKPAWLSWSTTGWSSSSVLKKWIWQLRWMWWIIHLYGVFIYTRIRNYTRFHKKLHRPQ